LPLDSRRYIAYKDGMRDIFDVALMGLKADSRSLNEIAAEMGVPAETLRDIKSGHVSNPRIDTLRKIAAHYAQSQKERTA